MNKNAINFILTCLIISILYAISQTIYSYFFGVPDMIALGANVSIDIDQDKLISYREDKLTSDEIWEIVFSNSDLRSLYDEEAIKPIRFDVVEYQDTLYLRIIHPDYDEGENCVEVNEYISSECGFLEEKNIGNI